LKSRKQFKDLREEFFKTIKGENEDNDGPMSEMKKNIVQEFTKRLENELR